MHSSTIHVPDELIVLVFAYELFDKNRVFIVVVLPLGRTLRATTSLDFSSLFIFYFLLLICFFVFYSCGKLDPTTSRGRPSFDPQRTER